jgi:hypothetical protein
MPRGLVRIRRCDRPEAAACPGNVAAATRARREVTKPEIPLKKGRRTEEFRLVRGGKSANIDVHHSRITQTISNCTYEAF